MICYVLYTWFISRNHEFLENHKFFRIKGYNRWPNYCDQTCDQVFKMLGNTCYAMFYILDSFQETTSFLHKFFRIKWYNRWHKLLFYLRSSLRSSDLPLFYFRRLFPSLSFNHLHSGLLFPILAT